MAKAKVSWLLRIGRLVSKTDNVMHFARLVKQACVDLVSDLFVYYRLGCEPFVCSWGLHNLVLKKFLHSSIDSFLSTFNINDFIWNFVLQSNFWFYNLDEIEVCLLLNSSICKIRPFVEIVIVRQSLTCIVRSRPKSNKIIDKNAFQ